MVYTDLFAVETPQEPLLGDRPAPPPNRYHQVIQDIFECKQECCCYRTLGNLWSDA